jgi:EpsI family protein
MKPLHRCLVCGALLLTGLGAQAGLERINQTERPPLRRPLSSLPLELGEWVGRDEPIAAEIVERAQTTEYLNRAYEHPHRPGVRLWLWINYSREGTNLRHTPEICLPSGGWSKVESQTRLLAVSGPDGEPVVITRLGYSRGELVEHVGFWYYIFGEGKLENFVRRLPITSRSSHGRTTRGSSMTVEIFYHGEHDPDGEALRNFAAALLSELGPILPLDRAVYHMP